MNSQMDIVIYRFTKKSNHMCHDHYEKLIGNKYFDIYLSEEGSKYSIFVVSAFQYTFS